MILTDINKINDLLPYVSLRLGKALAYLRDTDFSHLSDGEYEVEGREIYASVQTYETAARELKQPEAHKKYIDIQFLLKGKECIGLSPLLKSSKIVEDYSVERDLLFYENVDAERSITLKSGDLMIIFPWELHCPGCNTESGVNTVRKIVIKVKSGG
ncbi:MAG TPA: YhcH/YjgK/YiaL family protein [Candidatus Avacidaminococcus intestinavium]|uniref:YhcH/YjgK/YiaL family protein n=1 Tax=Candidatus Avacidaminococcus intestinavium TaxID=2840684 RepID=A0A9D1SL16_9FIRM|nr:YhcH/YjgK/YiaL family protein [Candidatus Avacidaminococcus intestinavium]